MGRVREGEATRARLVDAFLNLVIQGQRNPSKITVREITDAVGADRQTLYRHFSDVYALAAVAYEREMMRRFAVDDVARSFEMVDAHTRTASILHAIEDPSTGLKRLVLFLHGRDARGYYFQWVRREAEVYYEPHLRAVGCTEAQVTTYIDLWAVGVVAVMVDWMRGNLALSVEELVTHVALCSEAALDALVARDPLASRTAKTALALASVGGRAGA